VGIVIAMSCSCSVLGRQRKGRGRQCRSRTRLRINANEWPIKRGYSANMRTIFTSRGSAPNSGINGNTAMYVPAHHAFGHLLDGLGQCGSAPASGMTFADILAAIECELRRPFTDPNDPRLLVRRRRLRELFNGVPPPRAKDVFDQLKQPSDSLARLFRHR